jgi:cephalosporin hydroxylase
MTPDHVRHVVSYPLALAGAAVAHARLRRVGELSPEKALAFTRTFRWWRGTKISPTQQDEEILGLLRRLAQRPPRTVVEIGTDTGGTLFLWTRVAAPDAVLVAVDNQPVGALGTWGAWGIARRGFRRAGQRLELLIPRDSQDPRTVEEVRRLLGGRPVDFLFIDGDHEYEGVRRDFELWSPLVAAGGLIAFHDVNESHWPGVVRLWNELKGNHETAEYVADDPPGRYGIGVIVVSGEANPAVAEEGSQLRPAESRA